MLPSWLDKKDKVGKGLKEAAVIGSEAYKFAKSGAKLVGTIWNVVDSDSKKKKFDPFYEKTMGIKDKLKEATGGWETVYDAGDAMLA